MDFSWFVLPRRAHRRAGALARVKFTAFWREVSSGVDSKRMSTMGSSIASLEEELAATEERAESLRKALRQKEQRLEELEQENAKYLGEAREGRKGADKYREELELAKLALVQIRDLERTAAEEFVTEFGEEAMEVLYTLAKGRPKETRVSLHSGSKVRNSDMEVVGRMSKIRVAFWQAARTKL